MTDVRPIPPKFVHHGPVKQVGILGGSIAGCAVAAELSRAGYAVTVLEVRGEEPKDRGAGIGLPLSLVKTLVEHDLIDAETPHLDVHVFRHVVRDEREELYGRVLWEQSGHIAHFNWGALYRNLRRRVPEGAYHTGCKVTALRESDGRTVTAMLADGRTREFDLVVCADGYRSLGRETLFPDMPVSYARYLLWRGAIEEKELSEVTPLEGALCWPSYVGGHGPFFLVPGVDGSIARGRRLVNWGLNLGVYENERAELLTGSAPPAYEGPMQSAREAKLKAWVPEVLPKYYAQIVSKSSGTHVQKVYESTVPAYRKGRICLAGDAGALAQPHTGTGVLKGITDAITLADALRAHPDLDDALTYWSDERTAHGNELVKLARQIQSSSMPTVPAVVVDS